VSGSIARKRSAMTALQERYLLLLAFQRDPADLA
jgi:hypothetical protein